MGDCYFGHFHAQPNAMLKFAAALLLAMIAPTLAGCTAPTAVEPTPQPPATTTPLPPRPSAAATTLPVASPTATRSADTDFMQRPPGLNVRVMSFNVNWDSVFPDDDPKNHDLREFSRGAAFARILRAVRPDVICLQEINYLRGASELSAFLEQAIGATTDEHWQVANVRDAVIATHFGLQEAGYQLVTSLYPYDLQQAAALVDLPDPDYGAIDLYLICAHFKAGGSRSDILLRSRQADVIMSNVRDLESPGGELDLVDDTPLLIMGDFNIYSTDPALHARTLEYGDIYDEATYGADLQPDWDLTALADAHPSHNGLGVDFYTWRTDSPLFPWGPLDRIFYTDSVLKLSNAFILNTTLMSDQALASLGLQFDDVVLDLGSDYYDHLPLVADFELVPAP